MWRLMALVVLPGLVLAQDSNKATYYVGHNSKFINITFESQADLETIIGTTHEASGEIQVDFKNGTGSVSLSVPVASLKTGIDMRDQHLCSEMWLDAKKFPDVTFKSTAVKPVESFKNRVHVTGDLTIHGVTKSITAVVEWREIPEDAAKKAKFPDGKWMRFACEFKVKLSDHGVKVPDMLVPEVSDEWTVKMFIFAGTSQPRKK